VTDNDGRPSAEVNLGDVLSVVVASYAKPHHIVHETWEYSAAEKPEEPKPSPIDRPEAKEEEATGAATIEVTETPLSPKIPDEEKTV
jgi:hypothetical protein